MCTSSMMYWSLYVFAYFTDQSTVVLEFKQLSSGTVLINDPIAILVLCCYSTTQNVNQITISYTLGFGCAFFVHLRYLTLTLLMAIIYKTHTKIDKINLGAFARAPYNFIKSLWRLLQITSHYPMTDRGEKTS